MLNMIILAVVLFSFPAAALLRRVKGHDPHSSLRAFILGSENRGAFSIAAGISMSFVGGAATLNMASLGYQYGWSVLIDPAVVMIALVIACSLAPRIRNGDGITITQILGHSSPSLKFILGISSLIVYQLLTAAQFVAIGKLLSPFFPGVPLPFIVAIPAIVVFIYIYLRGFESVTSTDIFQLVLVIGLFVLPASIAMLAGQGASGAAAITPQPAPATLLVYLALPLVFVPVSQDTNIRIKAGSTIAQARAGLLFGGLLYVMLVSFSVGVGVYMRTNGIALEEPEKALPIFFETCIPSLSIFAIVAVFAAIVSTLDSFAFDAIVSASNDIPLPRRKSSRDSDRRSLVVSALAVLLVGLIVALVYQQILGLILGGMLVYVAVFIPVAVGRGIGVRDRRLVLTSVVTAATLVGCKVNGYTPPLEPIAFVAFHLLLVAIAKVGGKK